jgi:hypothetical protein
MGDMDKAQSSTVKSESPTCVFLELQHLKSFQVGILDVYDTHAVA